MRITPQFLTVSAMGVCCNVLAFLVTGCSSDDQRQGLKVPPELATLREDALACSRDVAFTRVENSEHCVRTAEQIFKVSKPECENSTSENCRSFDDVTTDILLIYQGAIAESLFEHGKGEEVEKMSKVEIWRSIYFNGKTMRRMFTSCLHRERSELAKSGLVPATSIMIFPLEKGQQCFRAGYPPFKTAPLQS